MVDEQNEHVVIEHFARVDYALLEPMIGAFQDSSVSVRVLRDSPGRQGSQGPLALLPTAVQVIVKVLEAGGGAVAAVAAKDVYDALKRGFGPLWENLRHTSDPGYSEKFSMKLSAICELPDGTRLKLLLDPRSQPQDAQTAVAQFLRVVKLKSKAPHSHSKVEAKPRGKIEIWVFSPKTKKLEPVHPDDE